MMKDLKIALASQSEIKIKAVEEAFKSSIVYPFKSFSGVNEQPYDDETVKGASARIASMIANHYKDKSCIVRPTDCDLMISIENGLFHVENQIVDLPVVVICHCAANESITHLHNLNPLVISDEIFNVVRARGFGQTIGEVMYEKDLVNNAKDPHADFLDYNRQTILMFAVQVAWQKLQEKLAVLA